MTKYLIIGTYFSGEITVCFDYSHRLKSVQFDAEMEEEMQKGFMERLPITEPLFTKWIATTKIKYTKIPADLSFEAFWKAFDYKVGNKPRAEKLWNNLTEEERCKVFVSIPKYAFYLQMHKNIEKLYPETFLNQKRYENEYK